MKVQTKHSTLWYHFFPRVDRRKKANCQGCRKNSSVLEQVASIKHHAVETGSPKFILQTVFVPTGRHTFDLIWSKVHVFKYSSAGADSNQYVTQNAMVFHLSLLQAVTRHQFRTRWLHHCYFVPLKTNNGATTTFRGRINSMWKAHEKMRNFIFFQFSIKKVLF